MKKLRKKLIVFLVLSVLVFAMFFTVGCGKNKVDKQDVPPVSGIETDFSLNYSAKELSLFETIQLRVKNYTDLSWESDNQSVASVDNNGLVTAQGFGTANIKASRGSDVDICVISVKDDGLVPAIKINVAEDSLSLVKSQGVSDSFKLECSVVFNGKEYSDGQFEYVLSNEGVVQVSSDGIVSALTYGSVELKIIGSWRNFDRLYLQKTILVNVNHDVSLSMSLEKQSFYTVAENIDGVEYSNTTYLNKTFIVDGADISDSQEVVFEISNGEIIDLAQDGQITAIKYGKAEIVAKLTLDGMEYVSLPLELEVLRPTVKNELTFVSEKASAFNIQNVVGKVLSYRIGNDDLSSLITTNSDSVSLEKSHLTAIKGNNVVRIETDIYIYVFDTMFATHSISNLDQLITYISGITTEGSKNDYVILTQDIDCSGHKFTNTVADDAVQWYKGHFNGLGHSIKNYDADKRGLFGCRLVGGPVIENLALYFNAGSSSSVALAERAWNVGLNKVYLKNMYVKIYSGSQINGLITGGDEGQCYDMQNVIVDVSNAVVEYALDDSNRGTASVNQVYAIGNPLSGKVMGTRGENYNEYTGTLSACQKDFFNDYAVALTEENGFNQYWRVTENEVYFGEDIIVRKLEQTTEKTLYGETWETVSLSQLTGEKTLAVYLNGVNINDYASSIKLSDCRIGSYNVLEVVNNDGVSVSSFVPVTARIDSGAEFLHVLNGFYNVSSSATNGSSGKYYVLSTDITLPQSGSTAGTWSTDANWNFESAHFNGLGYSIDCSAVKITGHGLFGDVRFSTIENVAILKATASSGKPIIASNAWGGATISNVYAECDYLGGNSVGLLGSGEANVKNCVVKILNVGEGTNYALSKGCKTEVVNCYAIGSVNKTTNLKDSDTNAGNDNTIVYARETLLYNDAGNNFTFAKGYNSYWQVKVDGVYLGTTPIISKD